MKKTFKIFLLNFCSLFLIFILTANSGCSKEKQSDTATMKKAVPVWAKGRETEKNLTLGFRGVFQSEQKENGFILKITASTIYRVFLNGEFLGYGPARACHDYFRIDEYNLCKKIRKGQNILAIEVAGYNVNSYYTLDQPSFLQAELLLKGKPVLATGNGSDFEATPLKERLQKVERYSFQRPFTEYYRLSEKADKWRISSEHLDTLTLDRLPSVKLLSRNILLPEFNKVNPDSVYAKGTIEFKDPEHYYKDRSLVYISDKFKGYKESELEVIPSLLLQKIVNKKQEKINKKYNGSIPLDENQFCTLNMGNNLTGFIGAEVSCTDSTVLYFYFDEILNEGTVNQKKRMPDVNNYVVYELAKGTYHLESFEPYTFKYLKMMVIKGSCKIKDVYLREYAYPISKKATFYCDNKKLNEIFKAAKQTFRQNSVDIFMDCPSRERAGWLCDSYFSAIVEKEFTGYSKIAHNYYENYALPEKFGYIPEGMVPMCYPSDHNDKNFIPNYGMWFIVQICDYAQRGGDPVLIAKLRPRIEGLLKYFEKFENNDGLLEKLKGWIFVEWSKANSFVQDVNYPSNMLYSLALESASKLYNNNVWQEKANNLRKTIIKQSYNGSFFVDNAVREKDGKLNITDNTTEVCQYFAFFCHIASPKTFPELWEKLTTEFGPNRDDKVTWKNVYRANAFIGNYLRMIILSRNGCQKQLKDEIQDYFYYMANLTGTLWENTDPSASCNHNFASYIGHILYSDILGVSKIDYIQKEITIRFTDVDIQNCSGVIPVGDDFIQLKWKRSGKQIFYSVKIPSGYTLKIENKSSFKLTKN